MQAYRPDKMINWSRVVLHTSILCALLGCLVCRLFFPFPFRWFLFCWCVDVFAEWFLFSSLLCSNRKKTAPRLIRGTFLNFFLFGIVAVAARSFSLSIHLTPRFILTRFKIKSVQFELFLFRILRCIHVYIRGGLCNAMVVANGINEVIEMHRTQRTKGER